MNFLFGFSGRIGRLQWWGAQLAMLAIMIAGTVLLLLLAPPPPGATSSREVLEDAPWGAFAAIIAMTAAMAWIGIASIVKRYHDRDKSGWWYLIIFVPLIGSLWQLVECGFLPGSDGANSYGDRGGGRSLGDFEDDTPVRASRAAQMPSERSTAVSASPARNALRPAGFGRRGI